MLSEEKLELLNKIQKKTVYEDKFFEKRSELEWFYELKKRGYFNPNPDTCPMESKEKGLFTIPQWNVLPYLEKVSQQVNVSDNEKYIDELLTIIKNISNYRDSNGQHIDNYRTWYYFTKILLNLPNEKITEEIINLIPIWLDSKFGTLLQGPEIVTKLLPKLLTDNPKDIKKAEKIIEYITVFKSVPLSEERAKYLGRNEECRLVIDAHWLKEAFAKYAVIIGERCTNKVVEDLTKKIKSLLRKREDGTYTSFYDEPEYPMTDPLNMLTFIFKRILISKAKSDMLSSEEILERFSKDKYLYFPKMALYIIGQNMDSYRELFWKLFNTEIGDLIIANTLYLGDELKHLLENLKNLTDEQRKTLNEKIENAVKKHDFKKDQEKNITLSKQKIYNALSHDSYFKNLYEEMKEITGRDVALQAAVGKVEIFSGPGQSPITKEEVLEMTNDKLVEYLAAFRTKDLLKGPTVEGLADLVGEVAKEMPEKFIENLIPFKDIDYIYIYEIFSGIKKAWNEKKSIDWQKIFEFIKLYVDRKEFRETNRQWVAGTMAELIQDGTRDDAWAFPEQHFEKPEEIIFLLLTNLKAEEDGEVTDYVTYTLNTAFGKTVIALILLALRIARVNDKKELKWSTKFKEKYEWILNNKIIEGYTCLGRYMPNFYYLDKEWIKEKIKHIENEQGNKLWEAFMDGYLSIGKVYDDLYNLMKTHYEYGLFIHNFKERRNREHLIQHICIGYLRGREKHDDPESFFRKIIDKWKPEEIREIIDFFWMQRGILKENMEDNEKKIREKIIEFWRLLHEKYKGKDEGSLTREDKQMLSAVSKLATFLPKIEPESFEWLMVSAPYVHEDFDSPFFIEYLYELKNKGDKNQTAEYIGDIYLKMLENITPEFDPKHIRSIVEFLYVAGAEDSANKIRNIYGAIGNKFLIDIYGKHTKKPD